MADRTTQVNDGLGLPYSLEAEQSVLGAVLVEPEQINYVADVLKPEYFYLPAAEAPDGVTAGWYLDDYATLAELTFAPGEGFILVSNFDSAFAQIPAALTAE